MRNWIDKIKFRKPVLGMLAVLSVGMLLGYWMGGDHHEHAHLSPNTVTAESSTMETATAEASVPTDTDTIYVCPMMCVAPQAHPGDCPICGMEMVATPGSEKMSANPRLTLAPETIKLAQIRSAPVERRFVSAEVRLFGQIEYDPVHISYLSAYVPGVIDRIYVKRAGQSVRWGDPLFDIYSPEILMIEEQMVAALQVVPGYFSMDESQPHVRKRTKVLLQRPGDLHNQTPEQKKAFAKINAMRQKLVLLGMEKKDIDELIKKGEPSGIATIYAQRSGVVIEQNAFEGTYVNTGTRVFAIANPKFIWARFKAYESDYPWIRIGQKAEFVTDAFPGETFTGKVGFIDPLFDTQSRTFDVGIVFRDDGKRFRPSMYVRGVIQARLAGSGQVAGAHTDLKNAPLVIPAAAPLITGKRAVVYVAIPGQQGVFEGREVTLGPRARDYYVVLKGLKEGEQVVVNGNFKIDSQVQILAKSSMMTIEGGHRADAHHHHSGSTPADPEHRHSPSQSSSNAAPAAMEHGAPAMTMEPNMTQERPTGGMPMGSEDHSNHQHQ